MNKILIVILVILISGGVWWFSSQRYNAETTGTTSQQQIQKTIESAITDNTQSRQVVVFDGEVFTPSAVTVNRGGVVEFRNEAATDLRIASGVHPTHQGYPTNRGVCSTKHFDSCQSFAPGFNYTFQFDETGSWQYHNHLNPNQTGMVVVK